MCMVCVVFVYVCGNNRDMYFVCLLAERNNNVMCNTSCNMSYVKLTFDGMYYVPDEFESNSVCMYYAYYVYLQISVIYI